MKTLATPAATLSRLSLARRALDPPLIIVLLAALGLRLLLWGQLPRTGLISDEGEYLSAANWLAHGRGFAWYQGYLWTRAPLYPLFVAAHLRLFGDALTPIYITQTILSLLNVALVYALARRLLTIGADRSLQQASRATRCATLAALLMALYLPFAIYPQVLLSETLYLTLLLGGFLALTYRRSPLSVVQGSVRDSGIEAQGDTQTKKQQAADGRRQTAGRRRQTAVGRRQLADCRLPTACGRQQPITRPPSHVSRLAPPGLPVSWSLGLPRGLWPVALAGVLFGMATLTRSLTLPFLPLVAIWLVVETKDKEQRTENREQRTKNRQRLRSLLSCLALVLGSLLVILPWTIYNSRFYGSLVLVDTSGAYNLLLGARTAYDGVRHDARTRDFALALLNQRLTTDERRALLAESCLFQQGDQRILAALQRPTGAITQGERQQLMTAEALCLIRARPLAFVTKSLAELVDLFQINYSGAERFTDGFALGRLPPWYAIALMLLDDTLYVLIVPLGVLGWALARRSTRAAATEPSADGGLQSLIGLWWLYNLAAAPLLFAINRFRLPLLPFAFIFAAYVLAAPPQAWRRLRSRYRLACGTLAALLALIATTPYAYLEPRQEGTASRWASYLGPYPSSLAATAIALRARPGYLREQQVRAALGAGDAASARALLASSDVPSRTLAVALPLLLGLEGRPAEGLALLAGTGMPFDPAALIPPWQVAVVRGDLLRRMGDLSAARAAFTPRFVDDANPVEWAWSWLHPPPLPDARIDLAGNLDLGYIAGCYLGEGDPDGRSNFRWCTDGAQLRFPGAGTGAPQTLVVRADGRGWPADLLPVPPVRVFAGQQEAGSFTPDHQAVREFAIALPPTPPGADVVITLRTATFVPGADRYLSQQGEQMVGQVQRLGVRLDWVELRS